MTQPTILYITVDELRFPTIFPNGISTPAEFLARFMPNLDRPWQRGVKFDRFYGGASDCTPERGTLITGALRLGHIAARPRNWIARKLCLK